MSAALRPIPGSAAVLREQLRAVGATLRLELAAVAGLMAAVTLLSVVLDGGTEWDLVPMGLAIVMLGLVAPLGVWKGAEPARRAYFWALPVDRPRHTLLKVFGGWAWLMALVGAFVLWVHATNRLTGGDTGVGLPIVQALLRMDLPPQERIVEMTLREHGWFWFVPFTAATVLYLLGSVVVLASNHPWRWLAGVSLGAFLLVQTAGPGALARGIGTVVTGRYGLLTLLTGHPARVEWGWTGWGWTTLLWLGLALAGVVAAAYRHQEA